LPQSISPRAFLGNQMREKIAVDRFGPISAVRLAAPRNEQKGQYGG
jgi:hypothetical protein